MSDKISVETKDLVGVEIEVSYRVNFEGEDTLSWFSLENYVQVLTDHCRSMLRSAAKKQDIRSFYGNTIDIVRDTLLGENTDGERRGLVFEENGMRIYDVEVLRVWIEDETVGDLLVNAQSEALGGAIELSIAEDKATRTARLEELARESLLETTQTMNARHTMELQKISNDFARDQEKEASNLALAADRGKVIEEELKSTQMRLDADIANLRQRNDAEMARLDKESPAHHRTYGSGTAWADRCPPALRRSQPDREDHGSSGSDCAGLWSNHCGRAQQCLQGHPLSGVGAALAHRLARSARLPGTRGGRGAPCNNGRF